MVVAFIKLLCVSAGERNYVQIQAGRQVVPTKLGITLVRGYQLIDPELCSPQVPLSSPPPPLPPDPSLP